MEAIKTSKNVVFDVIYDDGRRYRVEEGVLVEAKGMEVTFHKGTSKLSVLFAAVEALFEVINILGAWDRFIEYINSRAPSEGGEE